MMSLLFLMSTCSFLVQVFSKFSNAAAGDTLTTSQFLSTNQTLVSVSKTFELGFFTPSSDKWYLGIWYKEIPVKTIVWVANRDSPLNDSSGVLKIGSNGNIVVLNGMESVIWSSNNQSVVVSTDQLVCQLLDSGNLVLRYANDNEPKGYIWQGFNYPTDTLLAGMKLGWDLKVGLDRRIISWKNDSDPSSGSYNYGADISGSPQLVFRNGSAKLFRTGLWNGENFIGTPALNNDQDFKPVFVSNDKEIYYQFMVENASVNSRLILHPSGILQRLTWNGKSMKWLLMLTVGNDQCDQYGACGGYGDCNINSAPICGCFHGFTPKSPQDYDQLDWSDGCTRVTPLSCNNSDGFIKFDGLKLPDSSGSRVDNSLSLKECEKLCLMNCSCTAYTNPDIRGAGSGCVMWFGDLVDSRQLSSGGQHLYVRMAASELEFNGGSSKKKLWVLVIILVSVMLGVLISIGIIWRTIRTKRKQNMRNTYMKHDQAYHDQSQSLEMELPVVDFVMVSEATNNFAKYNILGEGGFGPVYKGVLSTGQEIAVKRLSKNSGQGLEEFKNEVMLIAKLQHMNLVRLTGCCIQREENILIYEYMRNKSLDTILFDQTKSTLLKWQVRFQIIIGIAQGLLYLHRDSRLRIIHRDLKASNILLDDEMNPKISDFGMARTFERNQTESNTVRVAGTYGYMSPEYMLDGLFSMKSDVYSYGVLVLEIVSGKRNRGFDHPEHHLNLLGHAWKLWNEEKVLELMELTEDLIPTSEVLRCIHVGLLCVQRSPEDRPIMSSVVLMLSSEGTILPDPKQPGFYNERSVVDGESSSSNLRFHSSNEITISQIQGR